MDEKHLEFVNSFMDICLEIRRNSIDKGFWEGNPSDAEKLLLVISEVIEHFERLRSEDSNTDDEHCPEFSNLEIELADATIRLMDFCTAKGYRLGEAIVAKHEFNTTREHKHGKKF